IFLSSFSAVPFRATLRSPPSGAIYYPMDITLRDRESGDDGTEDESSGPGRIDGLLRVLEHRSRRDSELPGEGLRLAFRVREIPDGRVPLVPDARRRPRRNSTGSGEGNSGEHELRARRPPRCGAKEGRTGGWRDRPAARGRAGHGEFLLVPRARWPDPGGVARCSRAADGA